MYKKVLILTATKNGRPLVNLPHEAALQKGVERLQASLENTHCFISAINELAISVINNEVRVHDTRNDQDLREYDFVHFINTSFARDHFQAVSKYLTHHGVTYIDGQSVAGTTLGKISQMVYFAVQGIRVPDTLSVWASPMFVDVAKATMQLPCICKFNQGIKGRDNYLIETWESLAALLKERGHEGYVLQPFIPNDGDYRVLFVGLEVLVFYRQAQPGSHLNNTSQSGSGSLISLANCPPEIMELAKKAERIYGSEISGVDVLVNRDTNEAYVLEVNDTPAIFGGVFQDEKLELYVHYIQKQLQKTTPL